MNGYEALPSISASSAAYMIALGDCAPTAEWESRIECEIRRACDAIRSLRDKEKAQQKTWGDGDGRRKKHN